MSTETQTTTTELLYVMTEHRDGSPMTLSGGVPVTGEAIATYRAWADVLQDEVGDAYLVTPVIATTKVTTTVEVTHRWGPNLLPREAFEARMESLAAAERGA